MITHDNLRELTNLRSEVSVAKTFMRLVTEYLGNLSARSGVITDELYLLITLCNHHREVLSNLYRNGGSGDPQLLTIWIYELATPPCGEWGQLRFSLIPFIRTCGILPRPNGIKLFSPLNAHGTAAGWANLEVGLIEEPVAASFQNSGFLNALPTENHDAFSSRGMASTSQVPGGTSTTNP